MSGILALGVLALAAAASEAAQDGRIGIEEKLGQHVPLDATLRDERGSPVTLRNLVARPTILVFVYYKCPGICTPLLSDVARLLNETDLLPGRDFTLLSVSFDPTEGPELSEQKKRAYTAMVRKPMGDDAWRFLTADPETVRRLTDAAGFRYAQDGKDFRHAAALIVLSPDGKICRYLYGKNLLPMDLKLAVAEASRGETGPSVARLLLFCFSYDPAGRRYVVNVTRIAGAATVLIAGAFFLYLLLRRRRRPEVLPHV
ncbi:MAG: SCO family protein [Planctomycetes bacterium]|nr:SCO family protein [Planctomycetota bacterium]